MSGLLSDFIEAVNYSGLDQRLYARASAAGCIILAGISAITRDNDMMLSVGSAVLATGAGAMASLFSRKAAKRDAELKAMERMADLAPIDVTLPAQQPV